MVFTVDKYCYWGLKYKSQGKEKKEYSTRRPTLQVIFSVTGVLCPVRRPDNGIYSR